MGANSSKPPDRIENAEKIGVYARRGAGLAAAVELTGASSGPLQPQGAGAGPECHL